MRWKWNRTHQAHVICLTEATTMRTSDRHWIRYLYLDIHAPRGRKSVPGLQSQRANEEAQEGLGNAERYFDDGKKGTMLCEMSNRRQESPL